MPFEVHLYTAGGAVAGKPMPYVLSKRSVVDGARKDAVNEARSLISGTNKEVTPIAYVMSGDVPGHTVATLYRRS